MENDNEKNRSEARISKAYVKPAVVKHRAASRVVGSGCTQTVSNTNYSGGGCAAGLVITYTSGTAYYH
jgi:hypothetical protein